MAAASSKAIGSEAAPASGWAVGVTREVEVNIANSDHKNLACALKSPVAGYSCTYETRDARPTDKDKERIDALSNPKLLQPVMTVKYETLLAAGMWMNASLKAFFEEARAAKKDRRVNARCKYRVLGKAKEVGFQFTPGDWEAADELWMGTLTDCTVAEAPAAKSHPEVAAANSCGAARTRYLNALKAAGEPPDIGSGEAAAILTRGTYLNGCGVPPSTEVTVCAAVQNGRVVGSTTRLDPADPTQTSCVDGAVKQLAFPAHPRLDITTSYFAPQ